MRVERGVRSLVAVLGFAVLGFAVLVTSAVAQAQEAAPPTTGTSPPPPEADPAIAPPEPPAARYFRNAGRGWAWFYGGAEIAGMKAGFQSISSKDGFVGGTRDGGVAPLFGAVAGVRLSLASLAVRGRVGFFADYQLLTVGPELGLHIPLGNWEPSLAVGIGYARLLGVRAPQLEKEGYVIKGVNGRLTLGLDRWVSQHVTVGGSLAGELFVLARRETVLLAKMAADTKNPTFAVAAAYSAEGSSAGLGATLGFQTTYHF